MRRRQISCLVVCSLDDINFTVVRPCSITKSPERGPCSASTGRSRGRQVFDIGNEQAVRPRFGTLDSNTGSSNTINQPVVFIAIVIVDGINSHLSRSAIEGDEATAAGGGLVDIPGV